MAATSRVLGLMAVEGRLIRGRPAGGWTARQYRWHRRDQWWGPDDRPVVDGDEAAAAADLVARYLRVFGPATLTDVVWWTGWTKTRTRAALAALDVVEADLGQDADEPGLVLADDLDPVGEVEPWAALWPALDPTPMGWKQRSWYLGPHQEPLFDRNGQRVRAKTVQACLDAGWAEPWFDNPIKPDWQVCRLTADGYQVLGVDQPVRKSA